MKLLTEKKSYTSKEHLENFFSNNSNFLEKFKELNSKNTPVWWNTIFSTEKNFIDLSILNDLEITDEKIQLVRLLDNCSTKYGSYMILQLLNNPVSNLNTLNFRKSIIQFLNADSKTYFYLMNQLKSISSFNEELLWFWNEMNNHSDYVYNLVYYQSPYLNFLNKNELFLRITNIYKITVSPIYTAVSPLLFMIFPFIALRFFRIKIPFKTFIKIAWSQSSSIINIPIIKNKTVSTIMNYFSRALSVFFYFQNIYNSYNHSLNIKDLIEKFKGKLKNIKTVLNLNSFLTSNIQFLKNDKNSCELLNRIEHFTGLKEESTLFDNKGRILTCFYEFLDERDKFICALQNIGIIDAFCNICSLLRNNLNSQTQFTLPEFINSDKPLLDIDSTWHLSLYNSKNIVLNSLKFDSDNRNYLLTGPNAAGKSTFIKSVFINIYLSQTLLISNCKKISLTPFYYLLTSIRVQDEQGKESLFEAELYKVRDHLDKLKAINNKKFSFSVLDEIFTSTNYLEGMIASKSFCKEISKYKNSLHIITTHFTKLSKIEKSKKYKFNNIYFRIETDKNNKIVFPYKLERGVSHQYIALKLMKERGVSVDFINNSIKQLDKMTIKNKDNVQILNKIVKIKKKINKENNNSLKEIKE